MSVDENDATGNEGAGAGGGRDPAFPAGAGASAQRLPDPAPGIACWTFPLDGTRADARAFEDLLVPDEIARAARFGTEALRDRYVLGRGRLRTLLGAWLGVDPDRVPIRRGPRGRPELAGAGVPDFNLSHSRGVAILALAERGRVGVDVEHEARNVAAERLARKFLAQREHAEWSDLDPDARRRRFLRLWTCKEAMSKATGDALSAPLGRLDVEIDADGRLSLVDGPPPYSPGDWSLHPVAGVPGFLVTVAHWHPGDGPRG